MNFWFGDAPDADYARILGTGLHRVILRPSRPTALKRLAERRAGSPSFKQLLVQAIAMVDDALEVYPKTGWHVVDSSHLTVEQTVDAVLKVTQTAPA